MINEKIIIEMIKPYVVSEKTISKQSLKKVFGVLDDNHFCRIILFLLSKNYLIIDENDILEVNDELDDLENDLIYEEEYLPQDYVIHQSNEILCKLIQEGNQKAKNDLCIKNRGLVDKHASFYFGFAGNDLSFDDLEQYGMMGLLKAAEKFEISKGFAFSTYAVCWIKQQIVRGIYDFGFNIRVPVHMMELIGRIARIDRDLEIKGFNLNKRIQLIAQKLEMQERNIEEAIIIRNCFLSNASLDVPIGEEEVTELREMIPDTTMMPVEVEVEQKELVQTIDSLLKTLTLRESQIIILRFGLHNGTPETLEEIGTKFGVTRERIRQIESKALRKLRHPSRSKALKDFYS